MSDTRRNDLEVSDDEANAWRSDPARRVSTPATALIITGVIGLVANGLLGLVSMAFSSGGRVERPVGMDSETFESYQRGRDAAPLFNCCCMIIPALFIYPVVILGGVQMMALQMRWLAITGAIFALAPCSPAILLGVPIGIWCLIVLNDLVVADGFTSKSARWH